MSADVKPIEPSALITSADEIDNRLGPIPGRSSDRIARELRRAAGDIERMREAITKTRRNLAGLSRSDSDIYAAMVRRLDSALPTETVES